MKQFLLSVFCLITFTAVAQRTITNVVSGDLRGGLGLTTSKYFHDSLDFRFITFPSACLFYTPQLWKDMELMLGVAVDAKGGKTDNPSAKYRSYNVSAIIGARQRLKDFKIGFGVNPTYFIDTQKTVLEGSLKSGAVHFSVPHFMRYDIPVFLSAELKMHEKVNFEIRPSLSTDLLEQRRPFFSIGFCFNFLLAERYKREKLKK